MIVFWALVILMVAYGLGTVQGMSPEMRKAVLSHDDDAPADTSLAWLLLLAIIATIYLAALGQL